ncbi:MAG: hypothetical protein IPF57_25510 [Gammaproteobacteria bacterium]|nr:hypothetical protein [Gammaproteobacteria bacterium]
MDFIARSRSSGAIGAKPKAAVAEHHRGHAVGSPSGEVGIPEDLRVVVRVQVDEAGRDHQSVGVDHAPGARVRDLAHARDHAVPDADVTLPARIARAVHDHAVPDDDVEFLHETLLRSYL